MREMFYGSKQIKIKHCQKNFSQNYSAGGSEYTITELKYGEYKEPSVTKEVTSYFNIFECGRNRLDRIDVTCERVCMPTPQDKY